MKPQKTIHLYQDNMDFNRFRKERRQFETHKQKAHFYFDKIWRDLRLLTREEAYQWLSERLCLPREKTHFSKLKTEECIKAIYFCQQILNDNRRLDMDFGAIPKTPIYVLDYDN